MTSSLPLITHKRPDSILAWRSGRAITAARFLADVRQVAGQFPDGIHMLNACTDRYCFAVGLAAAIASKRICLLPATQTPETIRQLRLFAPDAFCLTDSRDYQLDLPQMRFPGLTSEDIPATEPYAVPEIDSDRTVAFVFTSGSTGVPVPHRKTWGRLVRNVQTEAHLCGLDDGRSHAIIGTVPPQHMYGLESTVMQVLQSGNALVAGRYFYPADIIDMMGAAPHPRVLVSTPVHMRALLHAGLPLPAMDLIMSATAPLSPDLALQLENALGAPLREIYGSTETGQIAVRQPTRSQQWQLFPGVSFFRQGEQTWACGGHVEQAVPMHDVIEIVDDNHFLLHGRTADMVNVAGKRNSLAYLNLQLNSIPGVSDGVFVMPDDEDPDQITRLAALVVAPAMSQSQLMTALRERIDPVFLPRPLVFLNALPRNSTGKLPHHALQELLRGILKKSGQT